METLVHLVNYIILFIYLFIYFFYSDTRLPQTRSKDEEKRLEVELSRIPKWLKMIKTWDKYWGKEKFLKRIHKGIPDRFRGTVWARLLFLEQMKEEQKGKYEVRVKLKLCCNFISKCSIGSRNQCHGRNTHTHTHINVCVL